MRVGDSDAARACLAADAALLTHADVAVKLDEVEAHIALLTAVGLCTMLPMHNAMLLPPCVQSLYGDTAPLPEGFTCLRLLHMDGLSCTGLINRRSFPSLSSRAPKRA